MKQNLFVKQLLVVFLAIVGTVPMWGESPYVGTFPSSGSVSNSSYTLNGVSWGIATTSGTGSPSIAFGNAYSKTCIKFGSGAKNCYGSVTLSTDYFSSNNYTVTKVSINALGSAAKDVTMTIGSSSTGAVSVAANSWTTLEISNLNISSGSLSLVFSLNGAGFFINSITITYSSGSTKTLDKIDVTTAPKTSYTTCETLVVSDWVVTGTYSDASTADVTSACTFSKANGASLLTTDTKVTVTHTATSKTCEKAITVSQGARDTFVDHIQGNADQYGECDGYTVPSCDDATKGADCAGEHYKFIGWSSTTISTGSDTEPAGLLKAGDSHDATGATYYAVWAKEE